MKKFIFAIAALALITSCSGNKAESNEEVIVELSDEISELSDDLTVETVETEETNESGYQAPIRVIATYAPSWTATKKIYTFDILTGGKMNGSEVIYRWNNDEKDYVLEDTKEFSGKWTTGSISMGDGYQPVFKINRPEWETIYLPNDCEYIWMCEDAWYECEKWNTDLAIKVTSVEKL